MKRMAPPASIRICMYPSSAVPISWTTIRVASCCPAEERLFSPVTLSMLLLPLLRWLFPRED